MFWFAHRAKGVSLIREVASTWTRSCGRLEAQQKLPDASPGGSAGVSAVTPFQRRSMNSDGFGISSRTNDFLDRQDRVAKT
jgi:hypothetical protein